MDNTEKKEKEARIEDVTRHILSIPRFTREKHDFSTLQTYLRELGNPEKGMRIYHVAGTNGKGSVTRMLSGFLQEDGRRTGSFYSPHLVRMNERIRVNGEEIPDGDLVDVFDMTERVRKGKNLPQLTFFEILFVMALLYFRKAGVTDAVLETGLGGRLDATTAVQADLYIITRLGMDHEAQLGNSLAEIAGEKAGIITGKSPLVLHSRSSAPVFDPMQDIPDELISDETNGAGMNCDGPHADGTKTGMNEDSKAEEEIRAGEVILRKAGEMGCREVADCSGIFVKIHGIGRDGIDFSFSNEYDSYNRLFLPTKAVYQTENAVTAITAARYIFPEKSREELQKLVRRTLSRFCMPGRLEEIAPGIYVDGAHNPSAAGELRKCLDEVFGVADVLQNMPPVSRKNRDMPQKMPAELRKTALIFAASSDKSYPEVLRILQSYPWERVILTKYQSSRAESPEVLRTAWEELMSGNGRGMNNLSPEIENGRKPETAEVLTAESLREAIRLAGDRRILITGSLYLVGEAEELIK